MTLSEATWLILPSLSFSILSELARISNKDAVVTSWADGTSMSACLSLNLWISEGLNFESSPSSLSKAKTSPENTKLYENWHQNSENFKIV